MKIHGLKYKLSPEINLAQYARDTQGFSPAELANLLNESGLEAIRRLNDSPDYSHISENITDNDFSNALDRLQYGIKTYTLPSDSWLRNLFSGNEAGKALVASVLRTCSLRIEKVTKVSIVPRTQSLSFTDFSRFCKDNRSILTRGKIIDKLKVMCAARAAEEELFGFSTSFTTTDMEFGLRLARYAVYQLGLSDLGTLFFASNIESKETHLKEMISNIGHDVLTVPSKTNELKPICEVGLKLESVALVLLDRAYNSASKSLKCYLPALRSTAKILNRKTELSGFELSRNIDRHPPIRKRVHNLMNKSAFIKNNNTSFAQANTIHYYS
jgi:ATP-dependent Zn protease